MLSFRRISGSIRSLGLLVILLGHYCLAQTPVASSRVISGSVHDPSDAAIVGAEVDLVLSDGKIIAQTRTDSNGNFRFNGVSSGNYRLEAQHEGFRNTA